MEGKETFPGHTEQKNILIYLIFFLFLDYREKKMKIQDIKNNIKEAIEVSLPAVPCFD